MFWIARLKLLEYTLVVPNQVLALQSECVVVDLSHTLKRRVFDHITSLIK